MKYIYTLLMKSISHLSSGLVHLAYITFNLLAVWQQLENICTSLAGLTVH